MSLDPSTVFLTKIIKDGKEFSSLYTIEKMFENCKNRVKSDRYKDVADLKKDSLLYVLNENLEPSKVHSIIRTRFDDKTNLIYIDTLNGSSIKITSNHDFILTDDKTRLTRELQQNKSFVKTLKPRIVLKEDENKFIDESSAYLLGKCILDERFVNAILDSSFFSENSPFIYYLKEGLPTRILTWSKAQVISFLAGMIDRYGFINSKAKTISLSSSDYSLIQKIAEILKIFGFSAVRIRIKKDSINLESLIYTVTFYVTFEELIKKSDLLSDKIEYINLKESVYRKELESKKICNKIVLPKKFCPEFVYDIVTETGTFYCQGFLLSN